jgi:hypothetical protein
VVELGEQTARLGIVGLEAERLPGVGAGVGEPPFLGQHDGQVEVGAGAVRIEPARLSQFGQRVTPMTL